MSQRLLEGEVMDTPGDNGEVRRLSDELRRVTADRDNLRVENVRLRQRVGQVEVPAEALRRTLEPLYNALRAMMGEIEVIDTQVGTAGSSAPQPAIAALDGRVAAVWQSWKQRLGDTPAAIIDALQTHGEANTKQLAIICQRRRQTISEGICKLNKAGLVSKNAGRFSLKNLTD